MCIARSTLRTKHNLLVLTLHRARSICLLCCVFKFLDVAANVVAFVELSMHY